jgi:hypothetical protein
VWRVRAAGAAGTYCGYVLREGWRVWVAGGFQIEKKAMVSTLGVKCQGRPIVVHQRSSCTALELRCPNISTISTCVGKSINEPIRGAVRFDDLGPVGALEANFERVECYGSIRSEDAVPFPHTKTQRVGLTLLPFDPHLASAYQFPAIHPESSRLRPQVLLPVR